MAFLLQARPFAKYLFVVVPNKGEHPTKFRDEYKGKHLRSQEFFHKLS
jgi:hypothetical protein